MSFQGDLRMLSLGTVDHPGKPKFYALFSPSGLPECHPHFKQWECVFSPGWQWLFLGFPWNRLPLDFQASYWLQPLQSQCRKYKLENRRNLVVAFGYELFIQMNQDACTILKNHLHWNEKLQSMRKLLVAFPLKNAGKTASPTSVRVCGLRFEKLGSKILIFCEDSEFPRAWRPQALERS